MDQENWIPMGGEGLGKVGDVGVEVVGMATEGKFPVGFTVCMNIYKVCINCSVNPSRKQTKQKIQRNSLYCHSK